MKKLLLILISFITVSSFSQVSTIPAIPTATGEITILFDATDTELEDYTGDVYAHTGVLTTNSTSNSDWKYVIAGWEENTEKAKLTRTDTNTYEIKITPDVATFYNITNGDTVTHLAFVFRSSDSSKQSRPDYFIELFEQGDLNITFTNPENNDVFNLNDNITISAEASQSADLELFINNSSVETTTASTTISHNYTFTSAGIHTLKATATTTETKETEISVFVKSPTELKEKPAGLKYGLNKNPDNSVTFVLQAPLKNDVFIIGDFNNWTLNENYQMYKDTSSDDFWLTVSGLDLTTEYAYQYYVDYTIKIADPYAEKVLDPWNDQYIPEITNNDFNDYPTGLTEGIVSVFQINEEEYIWNITNFTKPNQDNLVVYELLIRDFTIVNTNDIGDFKTAITKLDYLKSLGINAIELMPVSEFEGNDSWGYNPSFHNALDKAYGSKNDFKLFVDTCHEKGIAVILDVVYNHAFGQNPMAQMYWDSVNNRPAADSPWFNPTPTHPYNVGNDFNHESEYTKTFVKQTLKHWINEFKIDGFRFDLSKGFTQINNPDNVGAWGNYDASRIAILEDYANDIWTNTSNDIYLILEHFADNSEETELADFGFLIWGNVNHNYKQNTLGYAEDSSLDWMSYIQRNWTSPKVVGYMESHDEERLMFENLNFGRSNSDYNVKDLNTALSRLETAGMFFFSIPGPKMIWQFGELGYDISINQNGRTGRKPVHWEYEDNVNRKHIYNTWATMIAFKQLYPEVFNTNDFELNTGNILTKSIILKHSSMDVVIVGNFDIEENNVSATFTKTGDWYEYFSGKVEDMQTTSQLITLKPGEYRMYSTVKLADPRGGTASDDSDGDGIVDTEDLCPNTMEGVYVSDTGCPIFTLPADNFEIKATGETCEGQNNGKIRITPINTSYTYKTTINGTEYSFSAPKSTSDLPPGDYEFCIEVEGESYSQCFAVTIEPGGSLEGKATVKGQKMNVKINSGTAPFTIMVNGNTMFETSSSTFDVDVQQGDLVEVVSKVACEGKFAKSVDLFDEIAAYPNPTSGTVEITIPLVKKDVSIEIYNMQSQLISSKNYVVENGKVYLNLEDKPVGLYLAKINVEKPVFIKIIKQ